MKKFVTLDSIGASSNHNTVLHADSNVALIPIPIPKVNYDLQYDPEHGILTLRQPDGSVLEASGFFTRYTIGEGEAGCTEGEAGCTGSNLVRRGVDGADGKLGDDGLRGETGKRGKPGQQGYKGNTGVRGNIGLIGKTGPEGSVGQRGISGLKGKIGNTGLSGAKGLHGKDNSFSIVFAETEPEYNLNPGTVWYKLKTGNYDGKLQEACGNNTGRTVPIEQVAVYVEPPPTTASPSGTGNTTTTTNAGNTTTTTNAGNTTTTTNSGNTTTTTNAVPAVKHCVHFSSDILGDVNGGAHAKIWTRGDVPEHNVLISESEIYRNTVVGPYPLDALSPLCSFAIAAGCSVTFVNTEKGRTKTYDGPTIIYADTNPDDPTFVTRMLYKNFALTGNEALQAEFPYNCRHAVDWLEVRSYTGDFLGTITITITCSS